MRRFPPFFTFIFASIIIIHCGQAAPTVPFPEATPFSPEMTAELHQIRDTAAEARQLDPVDGITEGTITREQLRSYYKQVAELTDENDESGDLEIWNTVLGLLQMLAPGEDYLQEETAGAGEDILGLYFFDDDELVMIDEGGGQDAVLDSNEGAEIAHEYIHSFQDANFDFDHFSDLETKERKDKANTEYSVTIQALMEGDAQTGAIAYIGQKLGYNGFLDWLNSFGGPSEEDQVAQQQAGCETALGRATMFPYDQGMMFVLYLWYKGGWDQVNQAYDDPPLSTEQIMHPQRYLDGDKPLALKIPDLSKGLGKGWRQIDDSVFGEFDVYNYLLTGGADDSQATSAADGWNGGRMGTYAYNSDPQRVVLDLTLSFDDDNEAGEFYANFWIHVKNLDNDSYPIYLWNSDDGELQRLLWDGASEHIYGWRDGSVVHAVFAVQQDDLDQAMRLVAPNVTREKMSEANGNGDWPSF
jgi:hypothetical protein